MSECAAKGCGNKPWRDGAYCGPQCEWNDNTEHLSPAPWQVFHSPGEHRRYYITEIGNNVPDEYEAVFRTDRETDQEAERVFLAGLKALYGVEVKR